MTTERRVIKKQIEEKKQDLMGIGMYFLGLSKKFEDPQHEQYKKTLDAIALGFDALIDLITSFEESI